MLQYNGTRSQSLAGTRKAACHCTLDTSPALALLHRTRWIVGGTVRVAVQMGVVVSSYEVLGVLEYLGVNSESEDVKEILRKTWLDVRSVLREEWEEAQLKKRGE